MSGTTANGGRRKTVVITGASGLLGRHMCGHFSRNGWQVRALMRNPSLASGLPEGTRAGLCDLPDKLDESLLEGADAFIHCAYATRAKSQKEARRVNEEGTRFVLDAARRAAIPRFVFISSLAAHPEAASYYARSKFQMEQMLDPARDLAIRPGLILAREGNGLFQRLRDSMRKTRVAPLFDGGKQPLQTVHVDDVCGAVSRAIERKLTGTINVAEPNAMFLGDLLRLIAQRLGVRCLFVSLPFGPVLAGVRLLEALRLPFPLQSENLLGLKAIRFVDVSDDLRKLGLAMRSAKESLADVL